MFTLLLSRGRPLRLAGGVNKERVRFAMWPDFSYLATRTSGNELTPQELAEQCRKSAKAFAVAAVFMYLCTCISLGLNKLIGDTAYFTAMFLSLLGLFALCSHLEYMDARKYARKSLEESNLDVVSA